MATVNTKNPEVNFESFTPRASYKKTSDGNPLMTQRYSADPWAMEYDGTLYVYMTGDVLEKNSDGSIKDNSYSKVNTLNILSTKDMVNWTDCGAIKAAGPNGAAQWSSVSWAPAAAHKTINGKEKFFLYFAAGGNGIGVLTSDSPTGPFTDPLGHALVSRNTPNCADVVWLFDPAVLVDDDGKAYLYCGGGVPGNNSDSEKTKSVHQSHPCTARAVELGDDMISIEGIPVAIDAPYLFEDSGINKFNGTYYYSYCVNWNVTSEAKAKYNINNAQIAYMTSQNPLGPFTAQNAFLKNPGEYFGSYGNNHHCIFTFKGKTYIAYHAFILQDAMHARGGYRSTNIDELIINEDGTIAMVNATKKGTAPVATVNPYEVQQAEMIACQAEIETTPVDSKSKYYGSGNQAVCNISNGSWIEVRNVDFGNDATVASSFNMSALNKGKPLVIKITLDSLANEAIGYCIVPSTSDVTFNTVSCTLAKKISGIHDLYFIFATGDATARTGNDVLLDTWKFSK
jgi:arabinoxylan arabinofuranohydrolase